MTNQRGSSLSDSEVPFWKRKRLEETSLSEWESLCDGCAWCCLYRLQDDDSGEVFTTSVACRLLDLKTCRCQDYSRRFEKISTCVKITPQTARAFTWLPSTCAYRCLAEGRDLPDWHPLISGDPRSVHRAGMSALGRAISELWINLEDLEDYLICENQED
ncbi:MAG: YcgN family cysteine cluster protein [Chloroflexota bacterium]